MSTIFANPETGEIDQRPVKDVAVEAAQLLVEVIWKETTSSYNVAPLTGLQIAQKIANAVLTGTIKEHVDVLAQPFKPQQTRMPGLE